MINACPALVQAFVACLGYYTAKSALVLFSPRAVHCALLLDQYGLLGRSSNSAPWSCLYEERIARRT